MEIPASSILERIEKKLQKTERYLATDEVVCACYLCKFLEYGDDKAYERFKYIFRNLNDEGKKKAIRFYIAYSRNNNSNQKIRKR